MRNALDKGLRNKLEKTVIAAREIAETAVTEVLSRLGVGDATAPDFLDESQRKLRNQLRAHGRQLGDKLDDNSSQQTSHLVAEMAYEHWHRMLFARFLEQNNLLMYDAYTSVTLEDCAELAEEEADCANAWELAGRLAAKMLPQIFRVDSPVFSVKLAINHVKTLEAMLAELDPETFQAQDSLGWCYQFWQSKRKKEVNDSGVKIGADEISPVTQLFTESYMVSFIIDNAIGAWLSNNRLTLDDKQYSSSELELRKITSIPGVPLSYLRFVKDENNLWRAASGIFDEWPKNLSEFQVVDPCCGSGHFLISLFLTLVPIRILLENLSPAEAIEKVLTQNIYGLEIDQRCIELAAFALALEAWRYPGSGGYRPLPELNLACSGLSLNKESFALNKENNEYEILSRFLDYLHDECKDASVTGSLIHPIRKKSDLILLQKLESCLKESVRFDNNSVFVVHEIIKTLKMLSRKYDWVLTNVPYLTRSKHDRVLLDFCDKYYPNSKNELAYVFVERMHSLMKDNGVLSVVKPQNFLYMARYIKYREALYGNNNIHYVARLGARAFEMISGEVVNVCLMQIGKNIDPNNVIFELDLDEGSGYEEKSRCLIEDKVKFILQQNLLTNKDYLFKSDDSNEQQQLVEFVECYQGLRTGDANRFIHFFWEINDNVAWDYFQSSSDESGCSFSGLNYKILWENGNGSLSAYAVENRAKLHDMHESGNRSWRKKGVAIGQMTIRATHYFGQKYDNPIAVVTPKNEADLTAIYCFLSDASYKETIKSINRGIYVTNAALVKIQFNAEKWYSIAKEKFPNGLPLAFSNSPIEWIYHGHPCASVIWDEQTKWTKESLVRFDDTVLQVAVARLLGYQWPAELDENMELAAEQRELVQQAAKLNSLADDDGIVCLPAVRGEKPAHIRLESMLIAAYEDDWSADTLHKLLSAVGSKDLETWLRDKFFEQHCKLFQHRPFIWQIWDGLKDGFSVLVNYHKLDYAGLERLIYTYLGDWIRIQEQGTKEGIDGAEARLTAARNLQKTLEAILAGETPLDIFVRWKPLEEQPIGWSPDLNDGVRLNIRPFMSAPAVGKKDAGILRAKPNINWKKDRGNDVESAPWYTLGPEYGETSGSRINDHHLSLAEKRAARETMTKEGS